MRWAQGLSVRYVAAVRKGQHAALLCSEKKAGRPAALTEDEQEIAAGWVLSQNQDGVEVHGTDFVAFVTEVFDVEISQQSALNYLAAAGFSSRVTRHMTSGYQVDTESLARVLWEWIRERRRAGDFRHERSNIGSIDFTYTSHRTERTHTFALAGSATPSNANSIDTHTNCIVTCIWADGVNRTPSMLFTYNQEFRTDRPATDRRDEQVAHFRQLLQQHEIEERRVVYIGTAGGETRRYVAENADLVRRFFGKYGVRPDCVVLSDNGNSFFPAGASVLSELGFCQHITYPSAVPSISLPQRQPLAWHSQSSLAGQSGGPLG